MTEGPVHVEEMDSGDWEAYGDACWLHDQEGADVVMHHHLAPV